MTDAERMLAAMDRFNVQSDGHYDTAGIWMSPTRFFVVDVSTAETDVNWPGELVSEHDTAQEARLGRAQAILDAMQWGVRQS